MELSLKISGKINLYLDILGQLADGYHAIDTVMQSVDLYDTLHISSAGQTRIFCPGVPQEKNSAYRAVQLFFAESGLTGGAEVHIRKVAPLGDPVEVTVRGYELSLRKADAEIIEVQ